MALRWTIGVLRCSVWDLRKPKGLSEGQCEFSGGQCTGGQYGITGGQCGVASTESQVSSVGS